MFSLITVEEYGGLYMGGGDRGDGNILLAASGCISGHSHPAGYGEPHRRVLVVAQRKDIVMCNDANVFIRDLEEFIRKNDSRVEIKISTEIIEKLKGSSTFKKAPDL